MSYLQRTAKGYLVHDTLNQRGLALAVLSHEGHLLPTPQSEVYMREHLVLAVMFLHLVGYYGEVAASQAWRKLQPHGGSVHLIHLYRHNLRQLFDTALYLHGFCGLVAEALYEVAHLGYLTLLVFVCAQLLFAALCTQSDILVVFHAVVNHLATGYLERT